MGCLFCILSNTVYLKTDFQHLCISASPSIRKTRMHLTARSKMTEKGYSNISNVCKVACVSFLCRHPYKAS